jgi:thiamine biosynthesis lipoprotein ApbE
VIHPDIIVADVAATTLFVTPIEQIETLADIL